MDVFETPAWNNLWYWTCTHKQDWLSWWFGFFQVSVVNASCLIVDRFDFKHMSCGKWCRWFVTVSWAPHFGYVGFLWIIRELQLSLQWVSLPVRLKATITPMSAPYQQDQKQETCWEGAWSLDECNAAEWQRGLCIKLSLFVRKTLWAPLNNWKAKP